MVIHGLPWNSSDIGTAMDNNLVRTMKPRSASASLAPTSCVTWSRRVKGRRAGDASAR